MAQTTYTLPFRMIDRPLRTVKLLQALWMHAPSWGLTVVSFGMTGPGRMQITLSDALTQAQIDHLQVNDPNAADEL